MIEKCYLVVGQQSWNHRIFDNVISHFSGTWHFIASRDELTMERLQAIRPRYVFLHWSYKVPDDLLQTFECVVFHMTDVPYGRGGSPLQNLIVRGHRETKLTALRMTETFDAGPVYMKRPLSLEGSTAEEIYIRATELSADMIKTIIAEEPEPVPQTGEPFNFRRRKPTQSRIQDVDTLQTLYDFIRMLDVERYPKAFIEHNGFRYEFNHAALYDGRVEADVIITPIEGNIS